MSETYLEQAIAWLPSEAACREAALTANGGMVEEGATWPYLWPGGLRLAADLSTLLPTDAHSLQSAHVVDLGCGRGLLGMAALALGFRRVTFVDGDSSPLDLLRPLLNNFPGASCATVSWGQAISGDGADYILGGDVLYRPEFHPALLRSIANSLKTYGIAYLGDPRSQLENNLPELAANQDCLLTTSHRPGPYSLCTITRTSGALPAQPPQSPTTI